MKLYSYCLRWDDGAAPNPFWGVCTLAICKPAIRRTAKVGDWVVGLGSANSPIGNISDSVVYAMRVTDAKSASGTDHSLTTALTLPRTARLHPLARRLKTLNARRVMPDVRLPRGQGIILLSWNQKTAK